MSNDNKFTVIPAVYLILQNEHGLILTMKRENTGFMDGMYGLPSGHVEAGETFTQALVREAKEEIGITIDEADLEFEHLLHRAVEDGIQRIDLYYSVHNYTGQIENMEPEKCSELKWQYGGEDGVIDYIKVVFAKIADGEGESSWGFEN